MTYRFSTAIVGGGALGLATARALLQRGKKDLVLLEKNQNFGLEQSGSNSGVIHAGFLYQPGTSMAMLCVEGVERLYRFLEESDTPFKQTGKLVVATSRTQVDTLESYLGQALANGVKDPEILSADEVKKREPCVESTAALFIPRSGIFDPSSFIANLAKRALSLHETPDLLMKGCKVVGIAPANDHFVLDVEQPGAETDRWQVTCENLVNAAGLYSADVAAMMHPARRYNKQYLRGEYFQFNCRPDLHIGMNVYPTPEWVNLPGGGGFLDLGAHLTPKIGPDGRGGAQLAREVLVGPVFSETSDPEDYKSTMDAGGFHEAVRRFCPSIKKRDLYRGHTGVLGLIQNQTDFMILRDEDYPHCIHLLAMESPALTASLAIGRHVADMLNA